MSSVELGVLSTVASLSASFSILGSGWRRTFAEAGITLTNGEAAFPTSCDRGEA